MFQKKNSRSSHQIKSNSTIDLRVGTSFFLVGTKFAPEFAPPLSYYILITYNYL